MKLNYINWVISKENEEKILFNKNTEMRFKKFLSMYISLRQKNSCSKLLDESMELLKSYEQLKEEDKNRAMYWPYANYLLKESYKSFNENNLEKSIIQFSLSVKLSILHLLYINDIPFSITMNPRHTLYWNYNDSKHTIVIKRAISNNKSEEITVNNKVYKEILDNENTLFLAIPDKVIGNSKINFKQYDNTIFKILDEALGEETFVIDIYEKMTFDFEEALTLLKSNFPIGYKMIEKYIRLIVPYITIRQDSFAFSNSAFLGAEFIANCFDNEIILGEQILHECAHNKLSSILEVFPISKEEEKLFSLDYSHPWRKDKRPMIGVVHATYVSVIILKYYEAIYQNNPMKEIKKNIIRLKNEIDVALNIIDKFEYFNDNGLKLIVDINNIYQNKSII